MELWVTRCFGLVDSGADNDTKVAIGTSAKLYGYIFRIFFNLQIEVLKVLVGWVSADGGQYP